jgi:Tfp pilus assembly protein FimT
VERSAPSIVGWFARATRTRSSAAGFTVLEMLITGTLIAVMTAAAGAPIVVYMRRARGYAATREIAGQIRSARLTAVTANKELRVRFNCPGPLQYRVLEFTNNAAIDNAVDRCTYPFPDPDPAVLPNNDGPPMWLPRGVTLTATQDLSISRTGVVTPLTGASPAVLVVSDGTNTRQITVSTAGRVRTP